MGIGDGRSGLIARVWMTGEGGEHEIDKGEGIGMGGGVEGMGSREGPWRQDVSTGVKALGHPLGGK